MNQKERELLNLLQFNFPLNERPWREIGQRLDLSEAAVLKSIKSLKAKGIIRRIGGVIEAKKIKQQSVLVAARVAKSKISHAAAVIAGYREITHCYLRSHRYNLWFTVTAPSQSRIKQIVQKIKAAAGLSELYLVPALKKFKIDTRFKL